MDRMQQHGVVLDHQLSVQANSKSLVYMKAKQAKWTDLKDKFLESNIPRIFQLKQ